MEINQVLVDSQAGPLRQNEEQSSLHNAPKVTVTERTVLKSGITTKTSRRNLV